MWEMHQGQSGTSTWDQSASWETWVTVHRIQQPYLENSLSLNSCHNHRASQRSWHGLALTQEPLICKASVSRGSRYSCVVPLFPSVFHHKILNSLSTFKQLWQCAYSVKDISSYIRWGEELSPYSFCQCGEADMTSSHSEQPHQGQVSCMHSPISSIWHIHVSQKRIYLEESVTEARGLYSNMPHPFALSQASGLQCGKLCIS